MLGGWEREVIFSIRLGFFTLDTNQRSSKAHILVAHLWRSPYPHAFLGVCLTAQFKTRRCIWFSGQCMVFWAMHSPGIANVRHPRGFEAGCVSNLPGLWDDTGLLTASSVFAQEQRKRVTSMWNAVSRGLCRLLHLKVAAQNFFQLSLQPEVQSASCLEKVKIEIFLFQNSSCAGGLSPTHLPPRQGWHNKHRLSLPV